MRAAIREALGLLLAQSAPGAELTLDAVGDALGDRAVTPDEIGWLLDELEAAGRRVGGAPGASALTALNGVLASARALRNELGRPARVDELAARSGLSEAEVRRALLFARVMGR
ncbi:MAG TPA: sigma-70 domain-containing protein [Polyangiaceae bacterium]|nr:sigma-70 domain-containing protein [Polyangiaceae bacterium]